MDAETFGVLGEIVPAEIVVMIEDAWIEIRRKENAKKVTNIVKDAMGYEEDKRLGAHGTYVYVTFRGQKNWLMYSPCDVCGDLVRKYIWNFKTGKWTELGPTEWMRIAKSHGDSCEWEI
ncbi:hypothetical protein BNJ_00218 [Kaumoebavirus]|uniref:hypothetical protein n=1 Tax=Kaumoebavirus TaxID=1859492 RepID=UPI0009C23E21|nr:hypothetical protein BNJ_00218 [Kaumoebavirus]ARA72047.1 hypothetical protein BNJ_00218 [Kaumoebavirus]